MTGRGDRAGETGGGRRGGLLGGAAMLLLCLLLPGPAGAGTALNQLCGAAGYGAGCVGAFKVPSVSMPRGVSVSGVTSKIRAPRVGGGAFGGIGGTIMGMFLEEALSSALESAVGGSVEEAAGAEAAAETQQVQALQEAVREQQRLQEEREAKLTSQLLDRSASQIIGGSQLTILDGPLETMRAEAGSPFDGNDPHTAWTTLHDTWYSPEPTGAHAGSSPVPVGEGTVTPSMQPLQCAGKLCAFPPGNVRVPLVQTAPTGPASQPGLSGSSTQVPGVQAEWRQSGSRMIWAARRDAAGALEAARSPEVPAVVLGSGAVDWAERALPGMQQEIAREGRDIYQRVMESLIAETFGVLSDAVSGNWERALERSDTIGDRVRESILPEFKMARLLLSKDGAGAGEVAGDLLNEQAKETAAERLKEDLLEAAPLPDWAKEGLEHSAGVVDHWLQAIRTR